MIRSTALLLFSVALLSGATDDAEAKNKVASYGPMQLNGCTGTHLVEFNKCGLAVEAFCEKQGGSFIGVQPTAEPQTKKITAVVVRCSVSSEVAQ